MAFYKPGVPSDALVAAVAVVVDTWDDVMKLFHTESWVTSTTDGLHAQRSYHYDGRAVDLRCRHLTPHVKHLAADLMAVVLGPSYRVLLEDLAGPNEHVHIEWRGDPRPPLTRAQADAIREQQTS